MYRNDCLKRYFFAYWVELLVISTKNIEILSKNAIIIIISNYEVWAWR